MLNNQMTKNGCGENENNYIGDMLDYSNINKLDSARKLRLNNRKSDVYCSNNNFNS